MVPEITPMLHVAQEQGLAVVRGLEMLTKQIEMANRRWCRTIPLSPEQPVR